MCVLNDFNEALRSFFRTHAALEIDVKLPTIKQQVNGHVRFYSAKNIKYLIENLVENSKTIDRCSYSPDYVSIWLKKDVWTSAVVKEILTSGRNYGRNEEYKGTIISVSTDECNDSVSFLRITLLKEVVQNLAEINGCIVGSNGFDLLVSNKNNSKSPNLIFCGHVICNITIDEYKQQKQDVITKMSANRIEPDEYPIDIISKLCHASIVYELLSIRHTKVLNMKSDTSNKDNGIFIMYNYSRLCQIWIAYEKGISEKYYESLPGIEAINFGLLSNEEEWLLIFNHLSAYPSIIKESVKYILTASVDIHRLFKFLLEMSSAVSLFYHRYHILSDPISSLLPLMYARLYLVKTSIQVYENIFQLLGIEAVCEM